MDLEYLLKGHHLVVKRGLDHGLVEGSLVLEGGRLRQREGAKDREEGIPIEAAIEKLGL